MKDKVDFRLVRALLKKGNTERANAFKKGNFDAIGFIVRLVLAGILLAAFIVFYGKFADMYLGIRTDGVSNRPERLFELLSVSYAVVLLLMVMGGVTQLISSLFAADDVKLYAAMPVGAKTLFLSRLVAVYIRQLTYAAVTVLPVSLAVALRATLPVTFFFGSALMCFLLPLISIGIASVLALPFYALWQFLRTHFVLNFVFVTALTGGLLYLYSVLLGGVKELLLGDGLKYFFNENVMRILHDVARGLYPCSWLADFVLGREYLISGFGVLGVILACLLISLVIIRRILSHALQSRVAGTPRFVFSIKKPRRRLPPFFALVKKEFLQIFRTPSYMFSYFSVAIVMPLMVYFCMDVGSSLVVRLIGIDCTFELSVFLTLLFGALTNVFCATNISRDGAMFYSVKAMPVDWRTVIFSKVALCMCVTVVSQILTAVILLCFGFIGFGNACFLFFAGTVCSFAQICLATRRDFNHARFSTEEDGEIKESGNTVSAVIMIGMAVAFGVGGVLVAVRMMLALRGLEYAYLSYLVVGAFSLAAAAVCCVYLIRGLGKKYYEFSGGGLF